MPRICITCAQTAQARHGKSPTWTNSRPALDNDPPQTDARLSIVASNPVRRSRSDFSPPAPRAVSRTGLLGSPFPIALLPNRRQGRSPTGPSFLSRASWMNDAVSGRLRADAYLCITARGHDRCAIALSRSRRREKQSRESEIEERAEEQSCCPRRQGASEGTRAREAGQSAVGALERRVRVAAVQEDRAGALQGGVRRGIEGAQGEIAGIAGETAKPTFNNTIVALEKSGRLLDKVAAVFYNLAGAHTNDALQAIERELAPKLAAHETAVMLNPKIFKRVEDLYERRDELSSPTSSGASWSCATSGSSAPVPSWAPNRRSASPRSTSGWRRWRRSSRRTS